MKSSIDDQLLFKFKYFNFKIKDYADHTVFLVEEFVTTWPYGKAM